MTEFLSHSKKQPETLFNYIVEEGETTVLDSIFSELFESIIQNNSDLTNKKI